MTRVNRHSVDIIRDRAGDRCEGQYIREGKGIYTRLGDCPHPTKFQRVPAHKKHKGSGGSKLMDDPNNLYWLCWPCHERFDQRITDRGWRELMGIKEE